MDRSTLKRGLAILAGVVLFWFLFVQNGGDTITILNRSGEDICEVYFSYHGSEGDWGRDRLRSKIQYPHSKDFRLPIYYEWFAEDRAGGYSGRVVSCDGEELAVIEGIGGEDNYFAWEVR